jgi:hypothetical protein
MRRFAPVKWRISLSNVMWGCALAANERVARSPSS